MTEKTPKTDLYTFVHKAHRARLFALSGEIGRADFSDPADVERVAAGLKDVIDHLREHSSIEEKYIHPLYEKIGDVAEEFEAEHQLLEQEIESLEAIASEARWGELHRAYNGFLGRYLVHLQEEEEAQEQILWPNDHGEMAETFARFQRERAPEKLRSDLEMFLPALSAPELTGMFTGMKLHAPTYVFEFAQGLAAQMTPPEIWAKVKVALAKVEKPVEKPDDTSAAKSVDAPAAAPIAPPIAER